jgi:branched-chain amino acid transport system substrate-binding protein
VYGKVTFDPITRRVAHPRDARLVIKNGKFVIWDGKPVKRLK